MLAGVLLLSGPVAVAGQTLSVIDPPSDTFEIRAVVAESSAVVVPVVLEATDPLSGLRPADATIGLRKGSVAAGDVAVRIREADDAPGRLFTLSLQLPGDLDAGTYETAIPLAIGTPEDPRPHSSLPLVVDVEPAPRISVDNPGTTVKVVGGHETPITLFLRGLAVEDLAINAVSLATDRAHHLSVDNLRLTSCSGMAPMSGADSDSAAGPEVDVRERIVTLCLAARGILWAGSYSGTIIIGHESGTPPRVSVPVEVAVRGPFELVAWPVSPVLPALLAALVIALGYQGSILLPRFTAREAAFRRGARAIALLPEVDELRASGDAVLADADLWDAVNARLNRPRLRLQDAAADLRIDLARARADPLAVDPVALERWEGLTSRLRTIATKGFDVVLEQWTGGGAGQPDPFAEAIVKLDAYVGEVEPDTDRAEVIREVGTRREVDLSASGQPGLRSKVGVPAAVEFEDLRDPEELIEAAERVRKWRLRIAYAVVGFLALFWFVFRNQAFGTTGDYVTVFTWAFGLAESADRLIPGRTPSQILADVMSP